MTFPPLLPHPGGLPQLILDSWAFLEPEVEPGEQPPIFGGQWVPWKGWGLGCHTVWDLLPTLPLGQNAYKFLNTFHPPGMMPGALHEIPSFNPHENSYDSPTS